MESNKPEYTYFISTLSYRSFPSFIRKEIEENERKEIEDNKIEYFRSLKRGIELIAYFRNNF